MHTLRLCIDVPGSVNHLYRIAYVQRLDKTTGYVKKVPTLVLTDEGVAYKQQVGWQTKAAATEQGFVAQPKAYYGYLALIYFPTAGSDLDNAFKLIQDSIFPALGLNDNRVIDIHAGKRVDNQNPRCEILLYRTTIDQITEQYTRYLEAHHVRALS
jgi:Holliday junction resolvase RusA-like endonuclease